MTPRTRNLRVGVTVNQEPESRGSFSKGLDGSGRSDLGLQRHRHKWRYRVVDPMIARFATLPRKPPILIDRTNSSDDPGSMVRASGRRVAMYVWTMLTFRGASPALQIIKACWAVSPVRTMPKSQSGPSTTLLLLGPDAARVCGRDVGRAVCGAGAGQPQPVMKRRMAMDRRTPW